MPTIDIDRDTARDAAEAELAKPIYPGPSLLERLGNWLDQLLYRVALEGTSVPGGWFTLTVLFLLVVVAIVVAVRVAGCTMRTGRAERALFDAHELSAAQHRATAEQHATAGEWAAAIRHRLRAVARHLEETGALTPVAGRTATELARDTGAIHPDLTGEMYRAAETFNDVTYGDRPGTEPAYRMIADLDERLRSQPPSQPASTPVPAGHGWAELR
ncbi:DUF4129 domain-containing protein [Mycolicibacterium thermoresistibile]